MALCCCVASTRPKMLSIMDLNKPHESAHPVLSSSHFTISVHKVQQLDLYFVLFANPKWCFQQWGSLWQRRRWCQSEPGRAQALTSAQCDECVFRRAWEGGWRGGWGWGPHKTRAFLQSKPLRWWGICQKYQTCCKNTWRNEQEMIWLW